MSPSLTLGWQNLPHWQLMEGREVAGGTWKRREDEKTKANVMSHIQLPIAWSHS